MKFLLYLFPALVNYFLGGMFFITAYRFSVAGASGVVVGAALAAWAVVYGVLSLALGRWTTPHNAPRLIFVGALLMAFAMLGFLIFEGLYTQFLWIAAIGVGSAFYCTPFQVFAKSLESDASAGVVRTTALYNFSWSFGMATGPFLFSLVSARVGFAVNFVLALAMALSILGLARHARRHPRMPTAAGAQPGHPEIQTHVPDLAWVSWTACGLGVVAVCVVRAMWPYRGAVLEIDKAQVARVLALVSYVQAFTVLLLFRGRNWFYRVRPIGWIGVAGIVGLIAFALKGWMGWFYCGAILFGAYSGCLFFCFVYYSLCHPIRAARYVAVNESVSGVTSFAGPLFGGWLAERMGSAAPFLIGAALVLAATLLHCLAVARTMACTESRRSVWNFLRKRRFIGRS